MIQRTFSYLVALRFDQATAEFVADIGDKVGLYGQPGSLSIPEYLDVFIDLPKHSWQERS